MGRLVGEEAAIERLEEAQARVELKRTEEERARSQAERAATEAKKHELARDLSFKFGLLISSVRTLSGLRPYMEPARIGPFGSPEEGTQRWSSDWKSVGNREEGELFAQLEQSLAVKQVSGYMGGYDYFSYESRRRCGQVNLRLISGGVEGASITSLLFENSAMDGRWGDVEAYVYPRISLYGKNDSSVEGRSTKKLLGEVASAFLPSDSRVRLLNFSK